MMQISERNCKHRSLLPPVPPLLIHLLIIWLIDVNDRHNLTDVTREVVKDSTSDVKNLAKWSLTENDVS
jgi:hypothetical protein